MKSHLLTSLALLLFTISASSCSTQTGSEEKWAEVKYTDLVDARIGTGGHGHVFYGANVPWGMVQLGPTSVTTGWDWCSGYHVSDSSVIGFSHTHLSGTGIGDLLDVTVMPVLGEVTYARGSIEDPSTGLWSFSDRSVEQVTPGYYKTLLTRYGIGVELTATNRVGLHKYTFPTDRQGAAAIIFDLQNGGNWDTPTESYIRKVDDHKIEGYRYSTGWAKSQKIYFTAEFSTPIQAVTVIADGKERVDEAAGKIVYGRIDIAPAETPTLVKVALSPTSIDKAWLNMSTELPHWDFERVRREADQAWEEALAKVRMESKSDQVDRIFYTALYHTMMAPSTFSDVDGSYFGSDQQVHEGGNVTNYTTLSLWDTYRAAHPLMTLIHPEMMSDIVETMLRIYKEGGALPIWHLMGNETSTMVGNPGIPVLADALLKGYIQDETGAYEAIKTSAMVPMRGMEHRIKYGYIPYTKMLESVAYELEYALADWAVAQAAKHVGNEEDYAYFLNRSKSYQHLFDPETGFMRGKDENGSFNPNFNPYFSSHREDDYCEGNAWQYTFLVPHDIKGLADCFGSEEALIQKLDDLFIQPSEVEGDNTSPDISGMIGQYAHGNEPGHHTLYLYSLLGQQAKAAPYLRQVMAELYHDEPDGLSGNEDAGQMSAWYILSALGLYQVEPAGGRYFFGSPIIDKAQIKVRDGIFTIKVYDNSEQNIHIQSIALNGKPYTECYLDFEEIARGGTLELWMGDEPNNW